MNFIELCISVMFIKLIYLIQIGESVAGHSQADIHRFPNPYSPLASTNHYMNHSLYC